MKNTAALMTLIVLAALSGCSKSNDAPTPMNWKGNGFTTNLNNATTSGSSDAHAQQ